MFPALQNRIYLNTAGSGILSNSVHQWRTLHEQSFLLTGSDFRLNQVAFLNEVKNSVARFFNSNKKYTYLTPNFSWGYQTILKGLNRNDMHRALVLDAEYPSLYLPLFNDGFSVEKVTIGPLLEERILSAINRFQPHFFAFSIVQYSNGIKLSAPFLSSLKSQFPDLILIADGTQYCGTEPFDFLNSPIDALAASGYKWMLAGYGNGFVLLKEAFAAQLYTGAGQRQQPKEPFLAYKDALSLYFEPGHQDTLAMGTLQKAIEKQEELGLIQVQNQIAELTEAAKQYFIAQGLIDDYILNRVEHSSIFKLNIDEDKIQQLQKHHIIGTPRANGFRVSFHCYNTLDEVQFLIDKLTLALRS
jgi:selenocysteine lyase/cysteine desulfurase